MITTLKKDCEKEAKNEQKKNDEIQRWMDENNDQPSQDVGCSTALRRDRAMLHIFAAIVILLRVVLPISFLA